MNKESVIKCFNDNWEIIEDISKAPFFISKVYEDSNVTVIKNSLFPTVDLFSWISPEPVDFSMLEKYIDKKKVVVNYVSDCYSPTDIVNLNPSSKVTLLESAVVYEQVGKVCPQCILQEEYIVENIKDCDIEYLESLDSSDQQLRHDYVQQFIDYFSSNPQDIFVLRVDGTPASFIALSDRNYGQLQYKNVYMIYTIPEFRQQGLAKCLLSCILHENNQFKFLYSADSVSNTESNKLALSCGFVKVGCANQVEVSDF